MAEIPDNEGAGFSRGLFIAGHIDNTAGSVMDRAFDINAAVLYRVHIFAGRNAAAGNADEAGEAVGDILVGRKFIGVDVNLARAAGQWEDTRGQFEQINGHGICDHDLVRIGPDQRCEARSRIAGKIKPTGAVPGPDQTVCPGLISAGFDSFKRAAAWRSQGMANQINNAFRQVKILTGLSQWIGGVQR